MLFRSWGRYKNFLIKLSESKVTGFDVSTFSGQLKDLLTVSTSITDQISPPKTCALFTGFLPFNLSLEMDGLSGMKNYERFAINESVLPYSYRSSDQTGGVIDFLIKGISHTVSNNQWKTKIESLTVSSNRTL